MIVYFLLALAAALAACAQLMFKIGASGRSDLWSFVNGWILGGLFCYGLGTVIWVYSLSKAPLNVVYPFTSLTFVLVFAGSALVIGESASPRSIAGVAIILVGIYLVSSGR